MQKSALAMETSLHSLIDLNYDHVLASVWEKDSYKAEMLAFGGSFPLWFKWHVEVFTGVIWFIIQKIFVCVNESIHRAIFWSVLHFSLNID